MILVSDVSENNTFDGLPFTNFLSLFEEIAATGLKDSWENAVGMASVVLPNLLDLRRVMPPLLIWG